MMRAFCRGFSPFIQQSLSQLAWILRRLSRLPTASPVHQKYVPMSCSRTNSLAAPSWWYPFVWKRVVTVLALWSNRLADGYIVLIGIWVSPFGCKLPTMSGVDTGVVESDSEAFIICYLCGESPTQALPCWWATEGPSIAWTGIPGRLLICTRPGWWWLQSCLKGISHWFKIIPIALRRTRHNCCTLQGHSENTPLPFSRGYFWQQFHHHQDNAMPCNRVTPFQHQ